VAANLLQAAGTIVVSAEDRHRPAWDSSSVQQLLPMLRAAIRTLPQSSGLPVVVPYIVHPALGELLVGVASVAGPSADLVSRMNDKRLLRQLLSDAGVSVPRWSSAVDGFERASSAVGLPIVLQRAKGSSGLQTWWVGGREDWHRVVDGVLAAGGVMSELIACEYLDGAVLNGHLGIGRHGTAISALSVQLAGLPGTATPWPLYSGNDFGAVAALPSWTQTAARHTLDRVARILRGYGYEGIAGVDLIVDRFGAATVLEVNPRLQGSSWLLGEAIRSTGVEDALPDWILGRVGPDGPPVAGAAQLLFRAHAVLLPRVCTLSDGVHQVRQGRLLWVRPGIGLADAEPDEIIVSGVPGPQVGTCDRDAVLVRTASRERLIAADGRRLTAKGRIVVGALLG
jgi:hypothetical protein